MIKNYLLFLILVIFINPSYSQVSSKFFKGGRELPSTRKINKEIIISADTLSVLRAQDEEDSKKGRPFRFGKAIPVDINLIENSEKEVHGDTVTFTYSIKAAGAFSINLIFDKLELSSTSSMYIYNKDGTFIYGPVKKNNVPESSSRG